MLTPLTFNVYAAYMNLETIFSIANATALIGWLSLAFLYKVKGVRTILLVAVIPLLLAVAYTVAISASFLGPHQGGFDSLANVALLFQNKTALLAGWIHYLCFDLLLGTYETYDAEKHQINHWLILPCLFFTFMFGPVGFLLYQILKFIIKKQTNFVEGL